MTDGEESPILRKNRGNLSCDRFFREFSEKRVQKDWPEGRIFADERIFFLKNMKNRRKVQPFEIKDCSLVTISLGVRALNLREFAEGLRNVHPGSIYHHFWGRLMQPKFDEPEYNNDFAAWSYYWLHDKVLAERLSMVNPVEFNEMEELRRELLDIVGMRLDESEMAQIMIAERPFQFLRSQLIIIDTGQRVGKPSGFSKAMRNARAGSIFYHFIDARRRTPQHCDDFSAWLREYGEEYEETCRNLSSIDPFFSSLKEVGRVLVELFEGSIGSA